MVNKPRSMVIYSNKIYGEAVKATLILLWETADRICGKRLKAVIPNLVEAMERHGHLKLESTIREKVLSISASTIDQAWIEQKNGAVIRKIVGHERFSGIIEGQVMAQLFQAVRLYVNYF